MLENIWILLLIYVLYMELYGEHFKNIYWIAYYALISRNNK